MDLLPWRVTRSAMGTGLVKVDQVILRADDVPGVGVGRELGPGASGGPAIVKKFGGDYAEANVSAGDGQGTGLYSVYDPDFVSKVIAEVKAAQCLFQRPWTGGRY